MHYKLPQYSKLGAAAEVGTVKMMDEDLSEDLLPPATAEELADKFIAWFRPCPPESFIEDEEFYFMP